MLRIRLVKDLLVKLDKELDKSVPVAIFVNKQDEEQNSMTVDEIKQLIDIDKLETEYIWKIM